MASNLLAYEGRGNRLAVNLLLVDFYLLKKGKSFHVSLPLAEGLTPFFWWSSLLSSPAIATFAQKLNVLGAGWVIGQQARLLLLHLLAISGIVPVKIAIPFSGYGLYEY